MNELHKEKTDSRELKKAAQEAIALFLTKKRRHILLVLYAKGRLSHGELAAATETSSASLSNILLKFEMFQYRLLDSSSEGKYRFYFLTELGKEYIRKELEQEEAAKNKNIISNEPFLIMQRVEDNIKNIQEKWGEKWEITLDDALLSCLQYNLFTMKNDEEIELFLQAIENALLIDYENNILQIAKAVSVNQILVDRLMQFLDRFEAYMPLLKAKNDQKIDELKIYEFLEIMTCLDDNKRIRVEPYIQELQWNEKDYSQFVAEIEKTVIQTVGKQKAEIYSYFNKYVAGNRDLSAFLAIQVNNRHKSGK